MFLNSNTLSTASAALVVILGLIFFAARLARWAGFGNGRLEPSRSRRLVACDSIALDRTRRLHLIRCDGRELVLMTGGTADLSLGWLPVRDGAHGEDRA